MFTDGYVPNWGNDWVAPVLWVVVDNDTATAEHGKTVHIAYGLGTVIAVPLLSPSGSVLAPGW